MGLLLLLAGVLLPGCWAVRGPGTMWGYVGGSLSVNCTYWAGQEMKPKFWCYPGTFSTCSAYIVITSSLQPAVRQNRFSIRDNRTRREFTVTMEGLAKGDEGTYICGVRTGAFKADERHFVKVIVAQGTRAAQRPAGARCICPLFTFAAPPSTPRPTAAGTDTPRGSPGSFRYFPVLAGLQVLALLAMSGAVLWASLRG
uniref:Immunoglobulin domain-containing protein n=1 Tax=Otus sunia TaxID=257818 RepID=A0A8C8AMU6_9STRI